MVQRPNFTNPMIYDPRPPGRYVSFADAPGGSPTTPSAPYNWPQDTLKVPNGFGQMSEVSPLNTILDGREFFVMNGLFTGANYTVSGGLVAELALPTPDDGDFWCTNIAAAAINTNGGAPNTNWAPFLYLQIQDTISARYLYPRTSTQNGIPLPLLNNCLNNANLGGKAVGAGARTNWIQPYPFLRGGSIRLTLTSPPVAGPPAPIYDIYISMVGWKEYSNAAT